MNDRQMYLRQWLARIIAENPEVIDVKNSKQTAIEVYVKLQKYWLADVQIAMESLLEEIMKKV